MIRPARPVVYIHLQPIQHTCADFPTLPCPACRRAESIEHAQLFLESGPRRRLAAAKGRQAAYRAFGLTLLTGVAVLLMLWAILGR